MSVSEAQEYPKAKSPSSKIADPEPSSTGVEPSVDTGQGTAPAPYSRIIGWIGYSYASGFAAMLPMVLSIQGIWHPVEGMRLIQYMAIYPLVMIVYAARIRTATEKYPVKKRLKYSITWSLFALLSFGYFLVIAWSATRFGLSVWSVLAIGLASGILCGQAVQGIAVRVIARLAEKAAHKPSPPSPVVSGAGGQPQWSVFYQDIPIAEAGRDRLGFQPLVNALFGFLFNRDTRPPLVIGVNGPWGSGKSSLMKMLCSELEKTGRFRTVWFNAWRYEKEERILAALLKTIAQRLHDPWWPQFAWRMGLERFKAMSAPQYFLVFFVPMALAWVYFYITSDSNAPDTLRKLFMNMGQNTPALAGGFVSTLVLLYSFYVKVLQPFRLKFRKALDPHDLEQRTGFIDEFSREFVLFQRAVGHKKLLICIDDLDRCPPDKVVEVLQTINLVITSEEGTANAFFLLGFDRGKVLERVRQKNNGERDGHEYLKKMITLSVSVPQASDVGIGNLVNTINSKDPESGDDRPWVLPRHAAWVTRLSMGIAMLALVASLALGGMWWLETGMFKAPSFGAVPFASDSELGMRLLGGAVGLLVATTLLAILFGRRSAAPADDPKYRAEAKDSKALAEAVKECLPLLPANPRDVIRLVNAMRFGYMLQSEQNLRECGMISAVSCVLSEAEAATLALLQYRHPQAFTADLLGTVILPLLKDEPFTPVKNLYAQLRQAGLVPQDLCDDLDELDRRMPISHFADRAKLSRFLELHRFSMDQGKQKESAPAPAGAAAEGMA